MGVVDAFLAFIGPYAVWVALVLLVVGILASVKAGLAGGTTAGLLWLAVRFVLVGIFLCIEGSFTWGVTTLLVAAVLGLADGVHERRLTRRDHARMRD